MKLSASIPDDLWEKAGGNRPDASPSRILQRVLQEWLEDRDEDDRPAFAEPPGDAVAGLAAARLALAEQGREIFQRGYRDGVEAARGIAWSDYEQLALAGFDVVEWLQPYVRTANELLAAGGKREIEVDDGQVVEMSLADYKWLRELSRWLGAYAWPLSSLHVSDAYVRGFAAALREVWESVERGSRLERAHRRLMGSQGTEAIERSARDAGRRWAERHASLAALQEVAGWSGTLTVREEEVDDEEGPDWRLLADGEEIGFDAFDGRFSRSRHLLVADPWDVLRADGVLGPAGGLGAREVARFWTGFRDGARDVYDAVLRLEVKPPGFDGDSFY